MVSRRFIEESTVIVFSAFLASLTAYLINLYPQESLRIAIILGISSVSFILLSLLYKPLSNRVWIISMKLKLRKPLIGIIKQNGCPAKFTSFTPEDWQRKLRDVSLRSKFIQVSEISRKFAAVLNPYGEIYPEEELLTLKTFERIKKYITDGGIFLCAGGLAFWYGGDLRSPGREVPLADEIAIYVPHPRITNALMPQHTYPPTYSLTSTPLQREFGVVTTWRGTERSQCFQSGSDRKFVGDIANLGQVDEVLHFRAVREPVRRCLPFLRVKPKDWLGDVYVITGVPYGKGCLILCGFDLTENRSNPQWDAKIHRANFEKICYALKNLLENRRESNIPLSAKQW